MFLQYYVTESTTGNRVNIEINAATKTDLDATRNGWQTVWNTDFILDPQKEKYETKPNYVYHSGRNSSRDFYVFKLSFRLFSGIS